MLEVGLDGVHPVDVVRARATRPVGTGQCPLYRSAGAIGEPSFQIVEHLRNDPPGRGTRLVGQHLVEFDEQGDEVQIGLHRIEQLGFEQQLAQVEPGDGVALHHLHHLPREVLADVSQPSGNSWRRATEPASTPRATAACPTIGSGHVVDSPEGSVDTRIVTAQRVARSVGIATTQHQPPATEPFRLRHSLDRHVVSHDGARP